MERWNEKNQSAILEYPFDYERYIEESIREIDDLDERRFAKTVLLEGLGRIMGCMEEKYRRLERRVYEEIEVAHNRYETVTTIIKREHFDPTNPTLFPVVSADLDETAIAKKLSSETEICIGTLFLEADDATAQRFLTEDAFAGRFSESEGQEVRFCVKRAERYRAQIEMLYTVFQDNHIPWETMHTGYLEKFFDVFLILPEDGVDYKNSRRPTWRDVEIQFGNYQNAVRFDIIPLWNMECISFDSTDFMLPCIDGIYYEHEFSLKDLEREDGYLIRSNEDILEIRHEADRIVIKSQKETFDGWQALHIVQKETVRSLEYTAPLLTNHRKDSFFRRISEKSGVQLLTKTDLFRRITELDTGSFIEVTGYEICESLGNYQAMEGMNWFVRDELFPMESRKTLLLKFEETEPGYYLNDSMVRFVVSQMQLEISEFRCVGIIVSNVSDGEA